MALPDAIDEDARRQWVVRASQPVRECRATSAGLRVIALQRNCIVRWIRDARKRGLHDRARATEVATLEQAAGRCLCRFLTHDLAELRMHVEKRFDIEESSQTIKVGLADRVVLVVV